MTNTDTGTSQWVLALKHIFATADCGWCRHCGTPPELVEEEPDHLILQLVHHETCPVRERGWSVDITPSE
jgi:hypothetical protein